MRSNMRLYVAVYIVCWYLCTLRHIIYRNVYCVDFCMVCQLHVSECALEYRMSYADIRLQFIKSLSLDVHPSTRVQAHRENNKRYSLKHTIVVKHCFECTFDYAPSDKVDNIYKKSFTYLIS